MAIPDFQRLMLPLLQFCATGVEVKNTAVTQHLSQLFGLSEADRQQKLPSGQQKVFENRVAWAKAHLKMAGLLEATQRGVFRITTEGQHLLASAPPLINIALLQTLPTYQYAKSLRLPEALSPLRPVRDTQIQTPHEIIETAYQDLSFRLADELLDRIKNNSPAFFEKLVVELLLKMGYGGTRADAGQAMGKSGDEGIDGIIKEDRLGLDAVYIQAKRWKDTVGRPEIQKFVGALHGQRAKKGIFMTTSRFSQEAEEYVAKIDNKIALIDGKTLCQLMIEYDIGVSTEISYAIKRIDSDYFEED
ncbi:restriction endonuclease [Agitococcus lubricus]|uniref:Restriction system protein n=1 Tax=Agitococcus lubricus TaxID=1077255 RepID=A0A2T5J490_9GAMM|nr:restriction endonuclease [Agitococcus lubricus]PTQ91424.1 restriction system protein [Agitococcus lubricus]